tara:strand:- start:70 stop:474 length:405 start_codon:yes stop_codon:yes gene_type:complete
MKTITYKPNRSFNEVKQGMVYVLTERDLLMLYSFMTPAEIIETFQKEHCPTERTIYNTYRKYGLAKPLQAKKILKQIIVSACPEECLNREWEAVAEEKFEAVKQMTIANIMKVICWHASLFGDIDPPPQIQITL